MTRTPAPPLIRVRNRAWVRLDSGPVSGSFWQAKDFKSPVSRLLISIVARLPSSCAKLVTNQVRSLPWIRGHVLQSFALNTWYSCSNYLFAQNSRILFSRVLREMDSFDNPLSISPSFPLQNFFNVFLALSLFVVYCLSYPTGISRFNNTYIRTRQ